MPTGDVAYTTLFGKPIIVLNSIDAARELLDKKGSNTCDRARAVVFNEMWVDDSDQHQSLIDIDYRLGWDQLGSLPYGDRFRKHRKLVTQVLSAQAVLAYHDLQTNNTKKLIQGIFSEPNKFDHLVFRYVSFFLMAICSLLFCRSSYSTLFQVTYGIDVEGDEDAVISLFAESLSRLVEEGPPGARMVDFLPFRKSQLRISIPWRS